MEVEQQNFGVSGYFEKELKNPAELFFVTHRVQTKLSCVSFRL